MDIQDFLSKLNKVVPDGNNKWKACCPAHGDNDPSLSIKLVDDGKILLKCFSGCGFDDIVSSMGLTAKDVMGRTNNFKPVAKSRSKIVAYYDYVGADGSLMYQVCRKEPKSFIQRCPNPDFNPEKRDSKNNPRWLYGRSRYGVKRTIFRLPQVLKNAADKKVVFIVEGEKDVIAVESLSKGVGLVATCNDGGAGAGKWEHRFSQYFKGCHGVYIIADNDPGRDDEHPERPCWQGQRHALSVQQSLNDAGVTNTKVFVMPEINGRKVKDVSDWVAAGGDFKQFKEVLRSSFPLSPEKYLNDETIDTPKKFSATEKGLKDLLGIAFWEASKTDDGKNRQLRVGERRKVQNEVVFDWLQKQGSFYYHLDFLKHEKCMFFSRSEKKLHIMAGDYFQSWLALQGDISRCDKDFSDCMDFLYDQALCGREAVGIVPEKYFVRRDNIIYVSSGDKHMVRVSAEGVRMVDNGTDGVIFANGETLDEWTLVDPDCRVNPFEECIIFKTMPVVDDAGWLLTLLWVLGVLYCHEKKPPIVAAGAVGSGKTRLCAGVFELLGMLPRINSIGDKSNAQDDFWVSLNQHGMICWDNVDTKIRWLPDALAAAATNGSVEVREKYSDDGIFFHRANSNVMITSANATFAGDAGLADRLITVRLGRLIHDTDDNLLTEDVLRKRNASLSWMCGVLSLALADNKPVPKGLNRRHPDWAEFAVRCGRAMDCEERVLSAIKYAEADKSKFAIENNWIGSILRDIIPPGVEWVGTSQELVEYIKTNGELNDKQQKNLSARSVGNQISLIWPHLEKVLGASKRIKTGRTEYSLVGLVGYKAPNSESATESAHESFTINDPPNPPNPPNVTDFREEEKSLLSSEEIEELAGLSLDGWED